MTVYTVPQKDGEVVIRHQYAERRYSVIDGHVDVHPDDMVAFRLAVPNAELSEDEMPSAPTEEEASKTEPVTRSPRTRATKVSQEATESAAPEPSAPEPTEAVEPVEVQETGVVVDQPSEES